ncbi:sigma-B regulation protein RsbU (phosphoserine phosphatase) [Marinitoga hydrogenitolerans DSM 16785]|uniref:Sigma-B regulation protein RsbU (Phosphoserine phosphatase) n=1 Tax=Marinitoga hydrogenitolerans (strain DSM 16785 / JCM 12826 / AT1271) TaxID=1122195 RepID=A0A1M4WYQ5_MARH1|nr:SpoIIE family protein phosphatase [Marinitoga hydrogenitolerans]SHE86340.1 sigma-B regulation protein RsbU (phosphoserine phosphatase) [Marinitoga hydrogenitolerans DSM 16785]
MDKATAYGLEVYHELNDKINYYSDEPSELEEIKNRVKVLIEKLFDESENYRIQLEEFSIQLEAQVEELSKLYEELTAVLDIGKILHETLDPRKSMEKIIDRINDIILYEDIIVGEFSDYPPGKDFSILHADFNILDFQKTVDIIDYLSLSKKIKPLIFEKHPLTNEEIPIMFIPIESRMKAWGFFLFYGSKSGLFTAGNRKIMESIAEQIAFSYDTLDFLSKKIEQEKLDEQLRIASEIQKSLLPEKIPEFEDIEIEAFYRPAYDIGGDYYDVVDLGEKIFLVLADVSGKSVPAALIMTSFRSILRHELEKTSDLTTVVSNLNDYISKEIPQDRFVTSIFMMLDHKNRSIEMINCGHNPTLILKDDELLSFEAEYMPIGIMDGFIFESQKLKYDKDINIVLYTDGITEARNEESEEFEIERLTEIFTKNKDKSSKDIVNIIIKELDKFVGKASQHDDTTLMIIKSK